MEIIRELNPNGRILKNPTKENRGFSFSLLPYKGKKLEGQLTLPNYIKKKENLDLIDNFYIASVEA